MLVFSGLVALLTSASVVLGSNMPLPFTRELKAENPPMKGHDILIATTLMSRCSCWPLDVKATDTYTSQVSSAVEKYQSNYKLSSDGIFGPDTANTALLYQSDDGLRDTNGLEIKASDYNVSYKIFIPVYNDSLRCIETKAKLFDANNLFLFSWTGEPPMPPF